MHLGQVRWVPDDGADGDRRREGVKRMQAVAWKQIRNCTNAIADGKRYPSLMEKLSELEQEVADTKAKIASCEPREIRLRLKDARRFAEARLGELQLVLSREPRIARAEIAKHVQKIMLTPEGRTYIASGTWDVLGAENHGWCRGPELDRTSSCPLSLAGGGLMILGEVTGLEVNGTMHGIVTVQTSAECSVGYTVATRELDRSAKKKADKPKKEAPPHLTARQRAFAMAYAQTHSETPAARIAGYSAKNPGQSGHQALEAITKKMPDIMDCLGLSLKVLIEKHLIPLLNAQTTTFAMKDGKLTDWIDADDNTTQLRARLILL